MTDQVLSQQETPQTMQARYERAKHLLRGAYSDEIVFNDAVYPTWIDDTESFWYIRVIKKDEGVSHEVRIVDAKEKTNRLAFDNNTLAMALEKVTGKKLKGKDLKFLQSYPGFNIGCMDISLTSGMIHFNFAETAWAYNLVTGEIRETQRLHITEILSSERVSPDGTQAIFIKDHNVWVRDASSGKERPLTSDGEEYNAYQTNFSVVTFLVGHWSPDGKQFLIIQHDTRQVEETLRLYYKTEGPDFRPSLQKLKGTALQGDKQIGAFRYVAIHVDTGKVQIPDYPHIANEWMLLRPTLAWWGKDSRLAYFVDADRYHKAVRLVEFDTQTGTTRVLFEETAATFFKFAHGIEDQPVMISLPETEELLWFSERSGWGHLYLYDLKTGALKNAVTTGEWLVRNVVRYEGKRREVFLQTAGRDAAKDPYYRDLVRVNIDTGELVALADSNHDIEGYSTQSTPTFEWGGGFKLNGVSPTGNYAVVTPSRVDAVPVTYLLDRQGEKVMTIEEADISRLPKGFQWPEPVQTVSADGKTTIYGVVYRPSDFSADKYYPVVSQVMNTPWSTFAAKSAFNVHQWTTFSAAAIAELGFIVVQFDGRGTPWRSKAFQDESYGDFYAASDLSDHVAGIRQLAERYPYLDLDRVGIVSEMFGNGACWGMLKYPDFYKVGVEAQIMDIRMMPANLSDQYTGPTGVTNNLEQLVGNLQGKLLLPVPFTEVPNIYGLAPIAQIILAGAFAKTNKDIDLLHDPSQGWGVSTYHIRRCWDYLVRYLQGNVPPDNFILNGTALWDPGLADQIRADLGNDDSLL